MAKQISMKEWRVAPAADEEFCKQFPELPKVVLQLLSNRNMMTQTQIDEFLHPDYEHDIHDPFLFRDMRKAVDAIVAAIQSKKKIIVHGDYDADGVCAATLLVTTIEALGGIVDVFLPDREKDGYGLQVHNIERFAKEMAKLIITADCGISNTKEIDRAKELGMGVIVTDHHTQPLKLPDAAVALIHPHLDGETYPFKDLAGGGVAWKLAAALAKDTRVGPLADGFEKWLLDCAAISTVADMVPLLGESRTMVKYGLIVLQKTRRPGLRALLDLTHPKKINATTIGFQIAPRINAAGRMDHSNSAYRLLMSKTPEEAVKYAALLDRQNTDRQHMTEVITEEARNQLKLQGERPIYFAHSDAWPAGLLGLVAGKLVHEFQRPVIATCLSKGKRKGSGRSIPQVNLIEALQKNQSYLVAYGGHPQAAGMTIQPQQEKAFEEALAASILESTKNTSLTQYLEVDAEMTLAEVNWELFELLLAFEPFGMKNPRPRFLTKGVRVMEVSCVGNRQQHLRLTVEQNGQLRKGIGFGLGDCQEFCRLKEKIDIVYEVDVNEWNGNRELQIKFEDVRKSL